MTRTLVIWWEGRVVGQLMQDRHGDLSFVYSSAWLEDRQTLPLSASLPKRAGSFSRRECRPFFGGLLPEEDQREAVAHALGVSQVNDFALLDRLGGDVAGALQLLPLHQSPPIKSSISQRSPKLLDEDGILRVLDALSIHPLLAGESGLRLSLAGAQSKVPVVLVGGSIALPLLDQPTTHILKPSIKRYAATTENEAFMMQLGTAVGLDVAKVEPRVVHDRTFLLVQRYDRWISDDGCVHRIHQEDFCQALGMPPERKYAAEGGPTIKDCFALLRRNASKPAIDVLKLLDGVLFNLIIGNNDGHGKNFSLLYEENGARFAPLYDLLATVFYPELSPKFAMKLGKRSTLDEMDGAGWSAFAKDTALTLPLIRRRLSELCERVTLAAEKVAEKLLLPGLNQAAIVGLTKLVQDRALQCALTI